MQTIVKASDRADFLALVPQLVGFVPVNSLVLVAFRGKRTCGALRVGLPASRAAAAHKRIANTLFGMLCKIPGADAVVPVVYTNDVFDTGGTPPWSALVETLAKRATLSGFSVKDALCVALDGWGTYLDSGQGGGHPLEEIGSSNVLEQVPVAERSRLVPPESLARLPECGFVERERVGMALRRLERFQQDGPQEDQDTVVVDPVDLVERSLTWAVEALDPIRAAVLLLVVASPASRDQMTLQYAFGRAVGERAFAVNMRYAGLQHATGLSMDEIVATDLASGRGTSESSMIGDLMMGHSSDRPNPERVERAITIVKTCVSLAPRHARPAPLCMLAWLSWSLGRGSTAGLFVDEALAIDPRYSMARLLMTMFGTGVLPEWAFQQV
jgi:hypothetical protein